MSTPGAQAGHGEHGTRGAAAAAAARDAGARDAALLGDLATALGAEGIDVVAGNVATPEGATFTCVKNGSEPIDREVVTVDEVVGSPMISDPLHRLDCCVITDGGGALIVTTPEIAKSLKKPLVRLIGHGEAMKGPRGGKDLDLTYSAGVWSGPRAFEEAGVTPTDIKYASIYDSFTITVLMQLEDLGFCKKGEGGKFVADGNLISGVGKLPFNTDGGGLCNNHPTNRGGITKVIEAVQRPALRKEWGVSPAQLAP